jgi:hypothetical protein
MANTEIYLRVAMQLEAMSRQLETISSDLMFCHSLVTARNSLPKKIEEIAMLQGAIADVLISEAPETVCRNSSLHQLRLLAMPTFSRIKRGLS